MSDVNQSSESGFSLSEVLVALLILTLASVTLLQCIELSIRQYSLTQKHWKSAVESWNRAEQMRSLTPRGQEKIQILPTARPLYRTILSPGTGLATNWEVLIAEK